MLKEYAVDAVKAVAALMVYVVVLGDPVYTEVIVGAVAALRAVI
jgi:hypothetical protein